MEKNMSKRTIAILAAAASLTLACICFPANLVSFIEYQLGGWETQEPNVSAPSVSQPQVYGNDSVYTGDIATCISSLEDALYDAENVSRAGEELESEYTLVTYTVHGDTLSDPEYASVPPRIAEYQEEDDSRYREIWDFVVDVIPADQRTLITQFVLYTDGVSGSLGAVEQTDDPHYWMLELDSEDSAYFPELSTTLIHEFAHLLTLNDAQVTTDYDVFNNPDDDYAYEEGEASCNTYFLFEGCSNRDSYMAAFYDQFWPRIYDEWLEINYEEDDDVFEDKIDAFYQEYADQFVSSYAPTSPEEDIAESFMYFIFTAKPDGSTISEQKILFFYDYPELVTLRDEILSNLCTYVD